MIAPGRARLGRDRGGDRRTRLRAVRRPDHLRRAVRRPPMRRSSPLLPMPPGRPRSHATRDVARADAREAATASIANQQIGCSAIDVAVDTTDFNKQPGVPGSVDVTVSCRLDLSDLAVPGVPGSRVTAGDHVQPARHLAGTMSRRDERGSITVWLALSSFVMIFLVGLAVDLGGQVHAHQRAHDVAAQAARAGGEEVEGGSAIQGHDLAINPAAARSCRAALPRRSRRHRHGRDHRRQHHHRDRHRLLRPAVPRPHRHQPPRRHRHRDRPTRPHPRR